MRKLTNFSIRESIAHREPARGGKVSIRQLFENDVCLISDVDSVNWTDADMQINGCPCGIVGCQPGGWVSIRKTNNVVILMPAWSLLAETYDSQSRNIHEYAPPASLKDSALSALYIEKEAYCNTLCKMAPFPDFDQLSPLQAWEVAKLVQLEAPSSILGNITAAPQLLQEHIAASSAGSFLEQVQALNHILDSFNQARHSVTLEETTELDNVVAFYVDISGLPEWKVLSDRNLQYFLYLEPGFIVL